MIVFKIAHDPPFSNEVRSALQACFPLMVSPNGDSAQFGIETVGHAVALYGTDKDKEIFKELEDSRIHYVKIEYEDK